MLNLEKAKSYIKNFNKKVVTFVGYSAAEYENKDDMLVKASDILSKYESENTIINSGATKEGIGAIYKIAKQMGFITLGVVSSLANKHKVEISPFVDHVIYVDDDTWGGYVEGSEKLSPTSEVIVEISNIMIGIGGGEVARDELLAAQKIGKEIYFYPAEMNHEIAVNKASRQGLPEPIDFYGAANKAFQDYL